MGRSRPGVQVGPGKITWAKGQEEQLVRTGQGSSLGAPAPESPRGVPALAWLNVGGGGQGAEGLEVCVVTGHDWAAGGCGNSASSRAGLGVLPTPTPTPPGSTAVCPDVGAHCKQPELGRWLPRKEAGEKRLPLRPWEGVNPDAPRGRPWGRRIGAREWDAPPAAVPCLLGKDIPEFR